MNITVTKNTNPKLKPDWHTLKFGNVFTDHLFMIDYEQGRGWNNARIIPYQNISLDPGACVFHYGVEVFEGMKAYYGVDGKIRLFRPAANANRINQSGARLCMPQLPVEDFLQGLKALITVDKEWIPTLPDTSLYIRPVMIATEPHLGVSVSKTYTFYIMLSPVGAYYPEGLNPVKIYVEDEYVRAVRGGTGFTKCGGNYAAGLIAQQKAHDRGYSQVLWLDGAQHQYIDEVGTMNVMFKINGEVITPALTGAILPGITRDSVLTILKNWGVKVSERQISLEEIHQAAQSGALEEAFGTGTAAVISPIGVLAIAGHDYTINGGGIGTLSQKLYDQLTGIQWGRVADPFGWTEELSQ
ncbi:MAG: branched-chain amino acid aminotransferase [Clostridiales bacterium]